MLISEFKEKIEILLRQYQVNTDLQRLNFCENVYSLLTGCKDEAPKALRWFFEYVGNMSFSGDEEIVCKISESELKSLQKQYGEIVDATFESLLAQNLQEELFYQKIWTFIESTPSIETNNAKIFSVYDLWTDPRIPYFHVGEGLSMSNQNFQNISIKLQEDIQKARFILNTNYYTQRTNRASELLTLLETHQSSKEEQAVLMAQILSFSSTISSRLLREFVAKMLDEPKEVK